MSLDSEVVFIGARKSSTYGIQRTEMDPALSASPLDSCDGTTPLPDLYEGENIVRERRADRGKADLENLWFLCGGNAASSKKGDGANCTLLQIIREQECKWLVFHIFHRDILT